MIDKRVFIDLARHEQRVIASDHGKRICLACGAPLGPNLRHLPVRPESNGSR